MKKYTKPTITCIGVECGQMIAASIKISNENAWGDACGKGQNSDDFWDDADADDGYVY